MKNDLKQHIDSALSDITWSESNSNEVLSRIQKESVPMKRKPLKLILIVALIAALTATCFAVGNRFGILDFAGRYSRENLPADAEGYVEERGDILYLDENLRLILGEVLYDGMTLRFTVNAEPADEKTLIYCFDEYPDDMRDGVTLEERYRAGGYEHLMHLDLSNVDDRYPDQSSEFEFSDNGVIIYCECIGIEYCRSANTDMALGYAILNDFDEEIGFDDVRRATFKVSAETVSDEDYRVCEKGAAYPHFGVTVEKLVLTKTPLELRYRIFYTVTDAKAFEAWGSDLFFEFIDPESTETEPHMQRLKEGVNPSTCVIAIDDTHFMQYGSLSYEEEHDTYYIRSYDPFEEGKPRYEVNAFQMK